MMMMMREAKQQDKLKRSFHAPRSPFLLLVLGISNSIRGSFEGHKRVVYSKLLGKS